MHPFIITIFVHFIFNLKIALFIRQCVYNVNAEPIICETGYNDEGGVFSIGLFLYIWPLRSQTIKCPYPDPIKEHWDVSLSKQ